MQICNLLSLIFNCSLNVQNIIKAFFNFQSCRSFGIVNLTEIHVDTCIRPRNITWQVLKYMYTAYVNYTCYSQNIWIGGDKLTRTSDKKNALKLYM